MSASSITGRSAQLPRQILRLQVGISPQHAQVPVVNELKGERTVGWLIEGLSPGGPDGKRSWNIQKKFGRAKTKLGYGRETVFHSFRMSFISKLDQTGCPPLILKKIVGHNDLTLGHYSSGALLEDMREAVVRVRYEG